MLFRSEQISLKPGFMKHNGGVMFRNISDSEYEFKSIINKNHLNAAGITHGGYLSALVDAGAGTAAHRAADNAPCVTISLDLKFIGASKIGDEIFGTVKILKKTKFRYVILEKILAQSVTDLRSLNLISKNFKKCWVNTPMHELDLYKKLKKKINIHRVKKIGRAHV